MTCSITSVSQDVSPVTTSTDSNEWLDQYNRFSKYIKNQCPTLLTGSESAITKRRWFARLKYEYQVSFYGRVCDDKMKIRVMLARSIGEAAEIANQHPEWQSNNNTFEQVWQEFKDLLVPADTAQKSFLDLRALRFTTGQKFTDDFERLFDEIPDEVFSDPQQLKLCLYLSSLAPYYQQCLMKAGITRYDEARGFIITLDRPLPGNPCFNDSDEEEVVGNY